MKTMKTMTLSHTCIETSAVGSPSKTGGETLVTVFLTTMDSATSGDAFEFITFKFKVSPRNAS